MLDFFEHVTVADLARHLSGAAASASMGGVRENRVEELRAGKDGPGRFRQAIPVRPTGSEGPLFLVHDGWGSVAYVQVLHHHLDEELPVYALPAAASEELPLRTVKGMASRLVRMVREVQPVGPCRLAGWSFRGILAYEMAAQLIGQDQAVEFMGMIDTYHPSVAGGGAGNAGRGEYLPLRILRGEDTGESDGMGPEDRASAASEAGLWAFATERREKGLLTGHLTVDEAREVQDRSRIYLDSPRGYSPRPASLPVYLFCAWDDAEVDPRRGWRTLMDDVSISVTPVPGTHLSMMEAPNVESLGRALSRETEVVTLPSRADRRPAAGTP